MVTKNSVPRFQGSLPQSVDLGADTIQKGIAELVGTFLLVLFGTAGAVTMGEFGYVFGFGVGLMMIVYSIGHISGAHVNPAVSLGLALTGKFPMAQLPVYVVAQIIGAILASGLVRTVYGNETGLGATSVADGFSIWRGFLLEMVLAAVLLFVIRAVATDKRAPAAVAGLAIGGALLVMQVIAGPVTGASFNPARSIGPALVSGNFTDLWVYLVAPFIGGALGALLYDVLNNDVADVEPDENSYESIR